ncbi:hypothetical protein DSO57_1039391 [Entomophthora muscae]|nr:hypothetical protein DSO57_1039391 [Entomophthora muscae]
MRIQRAKPVTFFIVRHGERQDHADPSWALTAAKPDDPPLTDRGVAQAFMTGQQLQSLLMEKADSSRPIHILTSPLLRCMQTASGIVAGLGKLGSRAVMKPELGLCEWLSDDYFTHQLGRDDLHYAAEVSSDCESDEEPINATAQCPHTTEFPKFPEAYPEMVIRATSFTKSLDLWTRSASAPPIVILVTHGAMVNGLMEGFLGNPFLHHIDPCSLSCVKRSFTGQYQPTMIANTSHLRQIL